MINGVVSLLPKKQQPGARKILENLTKRLNVETRDNQELVIGRQIFERNDVVDLWKWVTANQNLKGSEPEELKDFLFALQNADVLLHLIPDGKRRKLLNGKYAAPGKRQ